MKSLRNYALGTGVLVAAVEGVSPWAMCAAAVVWGLIGSALLAGADDALPRPTAALIIDSGNPSALLLERKLLADDMAQWLDRAEFEKLIREQQLSAALQAAGGSQRVALGKLLKADVLVMLRREEKPKPHHQVVVAETKRGLRLLVDVHEQSGDAEGDAAVLEESVRRALAKYRVEIREICAVPQFASENLSFEHEHLEAAYAKVIEVALASQEGLFVVELDEARALAKELAVQDSTDRVRRQSTLYYLGRFRHHVEDGVPMVRIGLTLKRGEAVVAEKEITVASNEATQRLRELAVALTSESDKDRSGEPRAALPSAATEAKLLKDQSWVHQTLGNWAAAAALAEASLLLEPNQFELRRRCVSIYGRYGTTLQHEPRRRDEGFIRECLQAHSRGLDHLEVVLREIKDLAPYERTGGGVFLSDMMRKGFFSHVSDLSKEVSALRAQVKQKDLESAFRALKMRKKAGFDDAGSRLYILWIRDHAADDKLYEFIVQHYEELKAVPGAVFNLAYDEIILGSAQGDAYVKQFESSDKPELRNLGPALRSMHERRLNAESPVDWAGAPPDIPAAQPLQFRTIIFSFQSQAGSKEAATLLTGMTRAGNDIDVYWGRAIYLMKRPGVLRQVWRAPYTSQIVKVSFDGKYLWASVRAHVFPHKLPRVVVIDPQSEKSWEVTVDDGLPLMMKSNVNLCGYAPGKACVSGWLHRSWIALVEFDPLAGGRPTVKTILEANVLQDRDAEEQIQNVKLAFQPGYMLHVGMPNAGENDKHGRILVGRSLTLHNALSYPLVINPASAEVTVAKFPLPRGVDRANVLTVKGDEIYTIASNPRVGNWQANLSLWIYRLRAPDFQPEQMMVVEPPGDIVFFDGKTYICGKQWHEVDFNSRKVNQLGMVPWRFDPHILEAKYWLTGGPKPILAGPETHRFTAVGETSHYGLLALVSLPRSGGHHSTRALALKFPEAREPIIDGGDTAPTPNE